MDIKSRNTQPVSGQFQYLSPRNVIFGPGVAAGQTLPQMVRLGLNRALIVTGRTLSTSTDLVDRVVRSLGHKCAGVFSGVVEHAPWSAVRRAWEKAREVDADLLIVMGGGSCVDTAKAVALAWGQGDGWDEVRAGISGHRGPGIQVSNVLPLFTVTTTLSGAEFSPGFSPTDEERGFKDIYAHPSLIPKVVFLDPEMTTATPPSLWASTGMKVLGDCVEAVSSPRHQPFTDALALHATRLITGHLLASLQEPGDLSRRGDLQMASWMAVTALMGTGAGLGAVLRHQIGALCRIPHGLAGTIVTPHVMAFNRPAVADRQAFIAEAMGLDVRNLSPDRAAEAASQRYSELARQLGIPARLRDAGVSSEALTVIAQHALEERLIGNNPRPVKETAEALDVLRAAW